MVPFGADVTAAKHKGLIAPISRSKRCSRDDPGSKRAAEEAMLALERAIASGDFAEALAQIDALGEIDPALMASDLLYFEALAAKEEGDLDRAETAATRFVSEIGRESPNYSKALEILLEVPELRKVREALAEETECDRLAGYVDFPRRQGFAGVYGAHFDTDAAKRALDACRRAVEQYPQEPFFKFLLARALLSLSDPDVSAARRLIGEAADAYPAFAAVQLAYIYEFDYTAPGGTADGERALELFQQACDLGEGIGWTNACLRLGLFLVHGTFGVTKDERRAYNLYHRVCDAGYDSGCVRLGGMYQHGRYVDEDRPHAVELYRRSCENGYSGGCVSLGTMYKNGWGVSQDIDQAMTLYRDSCEAGAGNGCTRLSRMYASGRDGVAQDEQQAMIYHRRACELGSLMLSCDELRERGEDP